MNFLAKNLRYLMGPMTQTELAELTGVGQTTISRIRNPEAKGGIRDPGIATFKPIADHFGVSLDDFLTRDLMVEGPTRPSQSAGFDRDRLGTALTAVEKALFDEGVTGKWGKVAPAVMFAYAALAEKIPQTAIEREIFDAAVKFNLLGEIYALPEESRRSATRGKGLRGEIEASRQEAGAGKGKRRN